MSYGNYFAKLPVSFRCSDCGIEVTLSMEIGKDCIFEETVDQARSDLFVHCGWSPKSDSNRDLLCKGCRPGNTP